VGCAQGDLIVLLDVAREFFDEAGWAYETNDQGPMLRAFHDGDTGAFPVYVKANEAVDQLVVYAVLPEPVPIERRPDVGSLLAGLNYGLSIGNFELDHEDGEVRFRAGIDVDGGTLTPRMVRSLAAACVVNLDLYRPAIRAVADGSMTAIEALDDTGA
jgi:hypothetical protein